MPKSKFLLALALALPAILPAQTPLKILKIDPPNWYATLPKPMLLVRGEGFTGATFTLSDKSLHIDSTVLSANGHWAQLWLSASPTHPETVQLQVKRGSDHISQSYTFAARRSDGAAGFSSDDAMYLIMTDRFADGDLTNDGPLARSLASSPEAIQERAKPRGWHGGDLRGIEQHLDYLQELGITAVWPTPVYQNHGPEAYHGYHCTDYYSVDEHYGSLADLQSLARSLHARGMKLVLDTVPNHVGPFHPWVNDEPAPDWFHGTLAHHVPTQYDFHYLTDPHSTQRDRDPILNGWFVGLLPDMNTESPAVAQYLRQNAVWWIEQTGADALRIDTFAYVNRQFWHDYDQTLAALFPHLTEVGEVLVDDPQIASFFAGGRANTAADGTIDTGLYTPFDFPLYYALTAALTGQKPMTAIPASSVPTRSTPIPSASSPSWATTTSPASSPSRRRPGPPPPRLRPPRHHAWHAPPLLRRRARHDRGGGPRQPPRHARRLSGRRCKRLHQGKSYPSATGNVSVGQNIMQLHHRTQTLRNGYRKK